MDFLMALDHILTSRPDIGYESRLEYDNDLGVVGVQRQNVDSIKESANADRNAWERGHLIGNTQNHREKIADIPVVMYFELIQRFGRPDQAPREWAKWLSENNAFLTTRRAL
jgi:hypothetical protein|tara:strand:- start:709 stop:1044 length:336 start_codon:yes stop_codon:yes gene_type:complete